MKQGYDTRVCNKGCFIPSNCRAPTSQLDCRRRQGKPVSLKLHSCAKLRSTCQHMGTCPHNASSHHRAAVRVTEPSLQAATATYPHGAAAAVLLHACGLLNRPCLQARRAACPPPLTGTRTANMLGDRPPVCPNSLAPGRCAPTVCATKHSNG